METKRKHVRVYRTAAELGITEPERAVLVKARNWLRTARTHLTCPVPNDGRFLFNMGVTRHNMPGGEECGSEGCIWGLCYVIAKAEKVAAFTHDPKGLNNASPHTYGVSEALEVLFFPHRNARVTGHGGNYGSYGYVTTVMAAKAVDHFLKTGEVRFTA